MQGIPSQQQQTHKTYSLAGAIGNEDDEAALIRGFNSVHIKHVNQLEYRSPSAYDFPGPEPTIIKFGKDGITLEDALQNRVSSGWGTELVDCLSGKGAFLIRFLPVGYHPGDPVQIHVQTTPLPSVKKAKLASSVAKALDKMLKDYARQRPSNPDQAIWVINKNVTLSDVILVEIRRMSKGSWQPVLFVRER
ncbi:hypothetical protein BDY19DRAFT_981641 [Irpex rosettiformis]|uniref:Uncharacterized protein n=1 Tax=Irpex rosettiformis TaxID=378272 RepID=A0ACB8TLQ6_9APHY|nr:hypothetical protein BDY19DRAFT_981641 [Irpex rosettiformis]